jgi:predicted RNase H-like nuclease (RuvC/YqgF family)
MTDIQDQIIEMLKQGVSYSTIQEELKVSSKTISAAKKSFLESRKSRTNVLSGTSLNHFPVYPEKPENDFPESMQSEPAHYSNHLKPRKTMSNYNQNVYDNDFEENELGAKISVEKLRLKLEHEREMRKLAALNEKESREFALREREIQIQRDKIEALQKQKDEEMRTLLFRIKQLTQRVQDGEYMYEEIEAFLDDTRKLSNDCEKFCFVNQIDFNGTDSHKMLSIIAENLNDFLENTDEDESNDLEFDEELDRMIGRATFRDF